MGKREPTKGFSTCAGNSENSTCFNQAGNTRLDMTADLCEKDQHILEGASMKQKEILPGFFVFFAQICCHFTPCIFRFKKYHLTPTHCQCVCATLTLSNQLCG